MPLHLADAFQILACTVMLSILADMVLSTGPVATMSRLFAPG